MSCWHLVVQIHFCTLDWQLSYGLVYINFVEFRWALATCVLLELFIPADIMSCHRANTKSNKLAVGRKKFNMDPKKVRIVSCHFLFLLLRTGIYKKIAINLTDINSYAHTVVWHHSQSMGPKFSGVPRWQPHCRSGLATLPSVGAVP